MSGESFFLFLDLGFSVLSICSISSFCGRLVTGIKKNYFSINQLSHGNTVAIDQELLILAFL